MPCPWWTTESRIAAWGATASAHRTSGVKPVQSPRKLASGSISCQCLTRQTSTVRSETDFCTVQGVSYSALRQAFKLHTGLAPHEYQLELRVSEAKKLLAGTGLPVKAIADKLGFQSAYYFSRLFKTKTGLSPEAWRHQAHGGDHLEQVAMRSKQRSKPGSPSR